MNRDATLTLQSPSHHSGMATFADTQGNDYFEKTETCEVREISKYVGPLVHGKPFGAKLDIEGSEMAIMPWLLAQPNLKFLIFEAAIIRGSYTMPSSLLGLSCWSEAAPILASRNPR